MLRLYDNHLSGNGYKPRLLLAHLGSAYEAVEVDIMKGESRTPEFLARNPNGRVPVLELDDGTCIAESNAILHFLAEGSRFLPTDRLSRALILQWMFFEQYSHEPFIAVARHWICHTGMSEAQRAQLPDKHEGGHAALAIMEGHLCRSDWFVGTGMTSPTSLSMPIPTLRTRAGSISPATRQFATGSSGSASSRVTFPCDPCGACPAVARPGVSRSAPGAAMVPNAHRVRLGLPPLHPCGRQLSGNDGKTALLLEQNVDVSGGRDCQLEQFRVPRGRSAMDGVIVRSEA